MKINFFYEIFIFLFPILNVSASKQLETGSISSSSKILFPNNFRDSIVQLHNYKKYHEIIENQNFSSNIENEIINQFEIISKHFKQQSFRNFSSSLDDKPLNKNVSKPCWNQVEYVIDGFKKRKNFALKLFDSFGKPPSGVLNGNLAWLGEFYECRNTSALHGNLTGKYVMISNPVDASSFFRPSLNISLKLGICVPNTCSQEDVYQLINNFIGSIPLYIKKELPFPIYVPIDNIQIQDQRSLDQSAIAVLGFICFILFIALIGTILDFYKRYKFHLKCLEIMSNSTSISENSNLILNDIDGNEELDTNRENVYCLSINQECLFVQVLISFSVYTNTKKLFKINKSADQLKCLDAIRFLSISWVILGHFYILALGFSDNPIMAATYLKRFSFLIVSNAFFSVDTFFLLSGLLTSYVFLRQVERENCRISVFLMAKYYLHRYWRVTPPYLIAILISVYLTAYLGTGPLYPGGGYEPDFCRQYWWRNILYINNIEEAEKWCFGVSWYLANDMQYHVLAPLILIPLSLGKKYLAFFISSITLVGNLIAIVFTLYLNNGIEAAQFSATSFQQFFIKFYVLPWCRAGPYIIGLLLGYSIFLYKKKIVIKINKNTNIFLWIISIFFCAVLVFGLYPDAKGENPLSREAHIIYQALSKVTWSLCLSFMIYACISSNGGIINDILSWRFWVPLSRLTYGAFLMHVMVMIYFNATREHLIHIQDSTMVYLFLANLVFSFCASYLFSLFFEIPLIGLEKFIFH